MIYCIDRFEGEYAICEDEKGKMINIEISRLPKNTKETDCFIITQEENILLDKKATDRRKKEAMDLQNKLFKK